MKKKRKRNPISKLLPFAVLGGVAVGGLVLARRHHDDLDSSPLWLEGDVYQDIAHPESRLLPEAPLAGVPLQTLPPEPVPPVPDGSFAMRWGVSGLRTFDGSSKTPVDLGDLRHPSAILLFAQWNEVLIEVRWYAMPYRLGAEYASKYHRAPGGVWYFLGGGGSVPLSTDVANGQDHIWIALEVVQGNLVLQSGRDGTPGLSGFLRIAR